MSTPNPADTSQLIYRSSPILVGYLTLAAALAFNACRAIYTRFHARQKNNDWATPSRPAQFLLFTILAALSLGSTWYYMFAFFVHTYRAWELRSLLSADQLAELSLVTKLELWLQNTELFREAWETVIETPARFWWSGQIFLWTTWWSVFLGVMARRFQIPRVWTYMLLGQIVAISFAQNLFFATILVSSQPQSSKSKSKSKETDSKDGRELAWLPPLSCEILPVTLSLLSTVLVPSVAHTKYFMATLLIPHLLLFVPAVLRPSHSSGTIQTGGDRVARRYIIFFRGYVAICIVLQAHATYLAMQATGTTTQVTSYGELAQRLWSAVYEHPAVSSVSWDVILCTTSAFAWAIVNGGNVGRMLGG
ncbi:hypothetical protein N7512_001300, partial [Penicillium capsulatum]